MNRFFSAIGVAGLTAFLATPAHAAGGGEVNEWAMLAYMI